MKNTNNTSNPSSSLVGFAFSFALTGAAYIVVVNKLYSGWQLTTIISVIALLQLVVQLKYFLHVGSGPGKKYTQVFLYVSVLMAAILIFGSIWIMNNLDYNMMHRPQETSDYIVQDELIKK